MPAGLDRVRMKHDTRAQAISNGLANMIHLPHSKLASRQAGKQANTMTHVFCYPPLTHPAERQYNGDLRSPEELVYSLQGRQACRAILRVLLPVKDARRKNVEGNVTLDLASIHSFIDSFVDSLINSSPHQLINSSTHHLTHSSSTRDRIAKSRSEIHLVT